MIRGDRHGRIPFALIAVLLLMSAGLSALNLAKLAHEDAQRRIREAQLEALGTVAEAIHHEVNAQAQYLALGAVARGTEGFVNESRINKLFRRGLADYFAQDFPRTIRTVRVSVTDFGGMIRLDEWRLEDLAPPDATRRDEVDDATVETPDRNAPDAWAVGDRLAYFGIVGFVNYTFALEDVTVWRWVPLRADLPAPVPLMDAKLEQATRRGEGDLAGVGRTVKAIVASVVQFRVLNGLASPARPGTATRDVLTADDVELAVNLAILLEEIRLFRAFDGEAAASIDAGRMPLDIPEGAIPPASERGLASLLRRYAANGSVDAVDLYALYTGLDVRGVRVSVVVAQALAALADDAVLKHLDYLGLTPLADWLVLVGEGLASDLDGFFRWLAGSPSREVAYLHEFVRELFHHAGGRTTFLGRANLALPARAYEVPNGSSTVAITIPAHGVAVPFSGKDLLAREYDGFWRAYYPTFAEGVRRVHDGVRDLANDIAAHFARNTGLGGLLGETVAGPLDPKDNTTFLAALALRVENAVSRAVERFRTDPDAIDLLMADLWEAAKEMVWRLVDHVSASYGVLVNEGAEIGNGEWALASDLWSRATHDADFASLDEAQRDALRTAIDDDVRRSGWARSSFAARREEDRAAWRHALAVANGTALPGSHGLRERLREAAIGAGGWLSLSHGAIERMLEEMLHAQEASALEAVVATRLDPFVLWDPFRPEVRTVERFAVRHEPGYVRRAEAPGLVSPLWIEVVDPASIPLTAETPNVHYTNPFERSRRPFTTQWTVRVRGAVQLRVETIDRPWLGPRGLEPAAVGAAWPLDFAVSVSAYSGWNLTGVRYHDSKALLADAWASLLSFLEAAWDVLSRVVAWLLDALGHVVRVVMDLVESLFAFADRVVAVLTKVLTATVDLLRNLAVGVIQSILRLLDAAADASPAQTSFAVYAYGMVWRVTANGADGRELEVRVDAGSAAVRFVVLDLGEAGYGPEAGAYDALAWWNVTHGGFRLDAGFDPLLALQQTMIEGRASWDDDWTLDFAGPLADSFYRASKSWTFGPIPVPPLGTAEVEVGVGIGLRRDVRIVVEELVARSFAEALASLAGQDLSWEFVGRATQAFARRLIANVVDYLQTRTADLLDVAIYVEVQLNPAAGPGGVGVRLAFVADGRAVRDVVAWVVRNVLTFFEHLLDPLSPADYEALPRSLPEHLFLRVEGYARIGLPGFLSPFADALGWELRLVARVQANAAAVGALAGQDWGRWELAFGAYVPAPGLVLEAFGAQFGTGGNLWLLRGTVHAP